MIDSDEELDLISQDLDNIGKLNLNYIANSFSSYLSKDSNLFNVKSSFSNELTKYISKYKEMMVVHDEDEESFVNSIKTVLSTRIQMNTFLHDLNLGLNITTAIERLQPITDLIHETIFLPAEDDEDGEEEEMENRDIEDEEDEETEPVGVDKIVNKSQPLIYDIVRPEIKRLRKLKQEKIEDEEDSGLSSSFSDIDGLTKDEIQNLTHLTQEEFNKEEILRDRIQRIQNIDIKSDSKSKLVTKLMMGNYYKYMNDSLSIENKQLLKRQKLVIEQEHQKSSEKDDDEEEVILTEEDQQPSYHDHGHTILGCSHYQTNCKIECPTCLKWFPCRFCHDSIISDHKLVRNEIKHILCMYCNTPQYPESNYCINCEKELANYFCEKCKLYDNDETKDIYHCDKCGICRLGLGLEKDYFHCDVCNICLSIDLKEKHKCVQDTTHCDCTICNEYLFTSVQKIVFMKCGHSIHQHCYNELIKYSYKCPICKKTIVNVESQFRLLDQEINQNQLPEPYKNWRCIISCNDCKGKSNCSYHVLGLKCKYCNSYNTNQLKLIKPEEEEEEEEDVAQKGEKMGLINEKVLSFDDKLMKSVSINLQTNFSMDEKQNEKEEINYEAEKEDDDDDDDGMSNFINFSKLTNPSKNNYNVSYVASKFQRFINNATKKEQSNE